MIDLTNFGFKEIEVKSLYCRICGQVLYKVYFTSFAGKSVRYGYCKSYSHGVTIDKS